jgi:primase-polymerase (primpol)-like protein
VGLLEAGKKVPLNAKTGQFASSTNPSTWARSIRPGVLPKPQGCGIDGLGFVFTENDPYAGIDLTNAVTQKL